MAGKNTVENVDVNLTATDKASKVIKGVAGAVEDLPDDVTVAVDAKDDATADLKKVGRTADELAATTTMIDLESSGLAALLDDLDDVRRAAEKTDAEKVRIDMEVDAAAKRRVVADLDDVERKGEGLTGGAVNSLSDLSGPLGDVSGQVGEFGQAFVGAAELAGPALSRVGVDVGQLAGALGIGGAAVGAVIYFWNTFVGGADKAKGKLKEVQEQMASGDFAAAAKGITEALQPWRSIMDDVGVSVSQATKFVTGQTDTLGLNADAVADATSKQHFLAAELQRQRQAWTDNHGDLKQAQEDQFAAARAIGATTATFLDQARNALPEVQKEILAYVAMVNGIPQSRFTEITTDANPDDVKQVEDEINNVARDRDATVNVDADTTDAEKRLGSFIDEIRRQTRVIPVTVAPAAAAAAVPAAPSGAPVGVRAMLAGSAPAPAAGAGTTAAGATVVYNVTNVAVTVPLGTPTADVGRFVADALDAHERRTGRRRRAVA